MKAVVMVVALAAGHAFACSCSAQVDSFPPSGATNVPTNVVLRIVNTTSAYGIDYRLKRASDQQEVALEKRDGPGTRLISLTPVTKLEADTTYELETTAPSGMMITFTTGATEDHDVPTKAELKSAAFSERDNMDSCGGSKTWVMRVEGGDDATTPREQLLLLVHGAASTSPNDAIGATTLSSPQLQTTFCNTNFDPPEGSPFTLGVQVMDLAGNVSEVSTGHSIRANSCAAMPGGALIALALALASRRRR